MAERKIDAETIVTPRKLAHYVVRAKHFEETLAWYQTVFGFKVQFQAGSMAAFVTFDDEHHRFAFISTPDREEHPAESGAVDHVAFTLSSLGELLGHFKRLKAEGIEPYWTINHGLTTSMYYRDPEGLGIEFQVENFEKVEELNAYIQGPEFAKNPIGVDYDPEVLCARYERGDALGELVKLGSAPKPA
jgi:catechol-2,3-dioxygenase